MDVIPAHNLGVLLCCALETETNTSIAQELGVQNNVMCQIGSNPDFTIFSFSFRLFLLLSSPLESKSTSTTYQNSLLVNVVENAAEDHNVGVWVVNITGTGIPAGFTRVFSRVRVRVQHPRPVPVS